jgi:hypothetical protein
VPERDARGIGREHARRETFLKTADVLRELVQEPKFGLRRHDRDRLQQRLGRRAEARNACEHGIPDGFGYLVDACSQRLDNEEGVACGLAVELVRIHAARFCKLRDRGRRERIQPQPPHRRARRELPEHAPQRVARVKFIVTEARDDEHRNCRDSACEQLQNIERGLIRPVHVLEHKNRSRVRTQLPSESRRKLVRHCPARDDFLQRPTGVLGNRQQRAKRPRSEQRIAAAPEDRGRPATFPTEPS